MYQYISWSFQSLPFCPHLELGAFLSGYLEGALYNFLNANLWKTLWVKTIVLSFDLNIKLWFKSNLALKGVKIRRSYSKWPWINSEKDCDGQLKTAGPSVGTTCSRLPSVCVSYHPIFLRPCHSLKLVSFLGVNRTKSTSVCPWLLRGAI